MPESIDQALIVLHRRSGALLDANAAAEALFAQSVEELKSTRWLQFLDSEDVSHNSFDAVFAAQRPVSLPPFVLRPTSDSPELAVAGLVLPGSVNNDRVEVLLWPSVDPRLLLADVEMQPGDSLAVLGVDRMRSASGRRPFQALLGSVTRHLTAIVRAHDTVAGPFGSSLILHLPGTGPDSARDICRALLSHLHRNLRREGDSGISARLRIGVAHMTPGRSLLSALLAADRAMLQARLSWASQQVRMADAADLRYLLSDAVQGGGIFVGSAVESGGDAIEQSDVSLREAEQPQVQPLEKDIEGYVIDNMEGAVDQATFLAGVDLPVAIVGAAGTGKMYVARILHEAAGGSADAMIAIDCRELRGRKQTDARLARELSTGDGVTLVLKSPHLLHHESQKKLARQISTRTLADVSPPRALGRIKFVALFPQPLERLVRKTELTTALASAFGGFPINVPPIKDRKQAVLRWAHKILGQEAMQRDRSMKGFTKDAEQAMLLYDWPGNISEMRQCISGAMDKTDKNWLTPVDLGLFDGIDPEGAAYVPESTPFLVAAEAGSAGDDGYKPSTLESLDVALGQAVKSVLELQVNNPLGNWLDDELVLATLERYRGDLPEAGRFLHTRPRNIRRWLPRIESREEARNSSALWQAPRRLLQEWVREISPPDESPMLLLQDKLLAHIEAQANTLSSARRARIFGVSTPTYLKRLKEVVR